VLQLVLPEELLHHKGNTLHSEHCVTLKQTGISKELLHHKGNTLHPPHCVALNSRHIKRTAPPQREHPPLPAQCDPMKYKKNRRHIK
jgi:hypothetical protein